MRCKKCHILGTTEEIAVHEPQCIAEPCPECDGRGYHTEIVRVHAEYPRCRACEGTGVKGGLTAQFEAQEAARKTAAAAAHTTDSELVPVAWRCFHCNQVFTDRVAAEAHFGKSADIDPACLSSFKRMREFVTAHTASDAATFIEHLTAERDALQKRVVTAEANEQVNRDFLAIDTARSVTAETRVKELEDAIEESGCEWLGNDNGDLQLENTSATHFAVEALTNKKRAETAEARVKQLEAALEPIAGYVVKSIGMDLDGYVIKLASVNAQQPTFADFERARAAIDAKAKIV